MNHLCRGQNETLGIIFRNHPVVLKLIAERAAIGCSLSTYLEGLRVLANSWNLETLARKSFFSVVDRLRRMDGPSTEA